MIRTTIKTANEDDDEKSPSPANKPGCPVGSSDETGSLVANSSSEPTERSDFYPIVASRLHMRVAFVSFETVHHRDSETNRRLHSVLELLDERGHDVHVFCARFWGGDVPAFERDGVTYHGVSSGLEAKSSFLARLPGRFRRSIPTSFTRVRIHRSRWCRLPRRNACRSTDDSRVAR